MVWQRPVHSLTLQSHHLTCPLPPPLWLPRRFSRTAVARVSDDYYPRDPASSTPHIGACAFNSLYMGALVQPDWDMFQSAHPAGEGQGSVYGCGWGITVVLRGCTAAQCVCCKSCHMLMQQLAVLLFIRSCVGTHAGRHKP